MVKKTPTISILFSGHPSFFNSNNRIILFGDDNIMNCDITIDYIKNEETDHSKEYQLYWEKWKEVYWWDLKSYFPDLEKKMQFCDVSIPKDLIELTGKPAGPVEGLAMIPDQVGNNKPSSIIPGIEGLFIVGDTAGKSAHGIGTQLACHSGIDLADAILGQRDMSTI